MYDAILKQLVDMCAFRRGPSSEDLRRHRESQWLLLMTTDILIHCQIVQTHANQLIGLSTKAFTVPLDPLLSEWDFSGTIRSI